MCTKGEERTRNERKRKNKLWGKEKKTGGIDKKIKKNSSGEVTVVMFASLQLGVRYAITMETWSQRIIKGMKRKKGKK